MTGAGTVVCEDVVVVLEEGVEAQAESDTRTAATRQGTMIFFTGRVVVLIVSLRGGYDYMIGRSHAMGC